MKILVTGGAGFIGSNFIHYWLSKHSGDEIVNLDKLTYAGNLDNLSQIDGVDNYSFVKGDIADEKLVRQLVAKADVVVNFAAETHVDRSIANSSDFIHTNVVGLRSLLEAVKANKGVHLHHVSTDEVFGSLAFDDEPFDEDSPYRPRSPYSASKAAGDHLVRAYGETYNIKYTISNCSNNYGPYQHPEKLIPLFITNLLEDKKVPVYGSGRNIRDWLYVSDHARAIDMIIQSGRTGETYCVGGDNELSNMEVTAAILDLLERDEKMIEYVDDRPGHDLRYALKTGKIKNELGWEPEVDFATGLRKTLDFYSQKKRLVEKIKS